MLLKNWHDWKLIFKIFFAKSERLMQFDLKFNSGNQQIYTEYLINNF